MRHSRFICGLTALLLLVLPVLCASAEGSPLGDVFAAARTLCFDTHNAIVSGTAEFSCNGRVFKTLQLQYVQDDSRSYYELKLFTPYAGGNVRETGWIIIAEPEDEQIYVMETFYPGMYKTATDDPQNTLLRRTVELDDLMDLAAGLVATIESDLPEGAVTTAAAENGGTATRVVLSGDGVTELINSVVNLAGHYAGQRFFNVKHDRYVENTWIDGKNTVTRTLLNTTARYALTGADVTFGTDAEHRLTGLNGSLSLSATDFEGATAGVSATFSFTASYGGAGVKRFDPDAYGVVPEAVFMGLDGSLDK